MPSSTTHTRKPTVVALAAAVVIVAAGAYFGYRFFFSHADTKPAAPAQTTQQLSSTDNSN